MTSATKAESPPPVDRFAEDPRSLGEIASDLLGNASTLIRQEVALAKAEAGQMASRAGKGAGLLGGAGVAGFFALLFASLAAWWGIAVLIGAGVSLWRRHAAASDPRARAQLRWMLLAAGLGLGVYPKPLVAESLDNGIVYSDLTSALYIQGYTGVEIDAAPPLPRI